MKPETFNQQPLCVSQQKSSFWSLLLQSLFRLPSVSRKANTLALRDTLVSLRASVNEVVSNSRHTAGIIFLLVIAPLSSVFYQIFEATVIFKGWYFANYYYYFYSLSPYFMLLFASIGIFLLFPVKCKTSYMATVWPIGYAITKLLYLGLFVENDIHFHSTAPWFLLIVGMLSAFGFLLSTDYLLYRKYHLKHGTIARIVGIIKAPGIDAATKMRLLEDQSLELENFNQRY